LLSGESAAESVLNTETRTIEPSEATSELVSVPLWRFYLYFLRVRPTGFGGPIALAGFVQRDLVEH
jgi:chromate transporter